MYSKLILEQTQRNNTKKPLILPIFTEFIPYFCLDKSIKNKVTSVKSVTLATPLLLTLILRE